MDKNDPGGAPNTFSTSLKLLRDGKQLVICHMGFRFDSYSMWCGHDCSYCYARGTNTRLKQWREQNLRVANLDEVKLRFQEAFGPDPKNSVLHGCLRHRYPIRVGTNTDCLQQAETKYRITYRFIDEILNPYDYPYCICTKSDLAAAPEYLALYRQNAAFQFTLSTLDEALLAKIERGAPSPRKRLETMKALSSRGYFVGCRISPHIPEMMMDLPDLVKALADHGCKHVISELLRITPTLNQIMIAEGGFDVISHYRKMGVLMNVGYYRYPLERKIKYQRELAEMVAKHGMTFATCADEDPSFHTVKNCCGFDNLPTFAGCPMATYDTAFRLCKEKGEVSFPELLEGNWCPDPKELQKDWDSGFFEQVVKNLQYVPTNKTYRYVEFNPTLRRVSGSDLFQNANVLGLFEEEP